MTQDRRRPDLRLRTRPGHPDFLDLPWDTPLEQWSDERLAQVAIGIHRHVVKFVNMDGSLYALKELPGALADREYRVLRRMAEEALPVVEAVGVARRSVLDDVVITRHLDFSLPYRLLFTHRRPVIEDESDPHSLSGLHRRLLDALTLLLVRMHLSGFYWGDCSLSNTLFRRDAGALAAYMVDGETGEWYRELSEGQRRSDLEIAQLNVAGGLMDLQAELGLPPEPDPVASAERLGQRYGQLWEELTEDVVIASDERFRIDARLRRLNELGFDVDEIDLEQTTTGDILRMRTSVAEQGYHRRRLFELTGLQTQENQARSLLNDLANYRAARERDDGRALPEAVAAYSWLRDVYQKVTDAVPPELRARLEPVEIFHEVIEHKWYRSELEGHDVGVDGALRSYLADVLPRSPAEKQVVTEPNDGFIGYG